MREGVKDKLRTSISKNTKKPNIYNQGSQKGKTKTKIEE